MRLNHYFVKLDLAKVCTLTSAFYLRYLFCGSYLLRSYVLHFYLLLSTWHTLLKCSRM